MKTLKQLCTPRKSVFDPSGHDVVLDLTDLIDNRIDAGKFFEENYPTDGMKHLLREAFRRFEGHSASGVIKLTQAMGGGKTHSMIALGLLAKHPELRKGVMGIDAPSSALGEVRVVAFTGRETDAPLGIWGSIADQLGKKELFKDYYAPLAAPGQSAWINLLKGQPLLILLDEIPPYLVNAKAKTIGNSDLAMVSTTALANLFVAIGKNELSNVCLVISDLRSTWEEGTQQIAQALHNLENELGRAALNLEPVGLNTDEVYHILRKRLFEKLPYEREITEVAQGYAKALKDARQMDIANISGEKYVGLIKASYPFHPGIKDLYARFRENSGFQQTRGLIRLMRKVVSCLYREDDCRADALYLIHAHDLDLNDREILTEVSNINSSLDNAISHDIAAQGKSIAEMLDSEYGGRTAQDVSTLLLVSSLANIPNAVLGLSLYEVGNYLCAPGRDITKLKEILSILTTQAWYLHTTRDGKLFFKNVQNLVAKLKTTADSYNREHSLKELRIILSKIFAPVIKDCYQDIQVLPPVDEITVSQEKVTLVVYEPYSGGLHPDLKRYYDDLEYKNRIMFLSGQKDSMGALLDAAREHKAILHIIDEMNVEKVPDKDPQRTGALEIFDKIQLRILSSARETFTTLTYPTANQLMSADFRMNFTNNEYRGEKEIREILKKKQKFTEEVTGELFRKKVEAKLFTPKVMLWSEIKKRAAVNPSWQWHHPGALDNLKADMIYQDQWRANGPYIEKGPFPLPETMVQIQEISRNSDTGEAVLKLTPVYGDIICYEIDSEATSGSSKVTSLQAFRTSELKVSFICFDSLNQHKTGPAVWWQNRITLKSRIYQDGDDKKVEIKAAPHAQIRYTTNGSDPKTSGGTYDGPITVPQGTVCVLAVAEKNGIVSDVLKIDIDWKDKGFALDPNKPVLWKRSHKIKTTKESYEFLNLLKKYGGIATGPRIAVIGKHWVEMSFDPNTGILGDKMEGAVEHLRGLLSEGQVNIDVEAVQFGMGQNLLDWVAQVKTEIKPEEVEQ